MRVVEFIFGSRRVSQSVTHIYIVIFFFLTRSHTLYVCVIFTTHGNSFVLPCYRLNFTVCTSFSISSLLSSGGRYVRAYIITTLVSAVWIKCRFYSFMLFFCFVWKGLTIGEPSETSEISVSANMVRVRHDKPTWNVTLAVYWRCVYSECVRARHISSARYHTSIGKVTRSYIVRRDFISREVFQNALVLRFWTNQTIGVLFVTMLSSVNRSHAGPSNRRLWPVKTVCPIRLDLYTLHLYYDNGHDNDR